MLTSAIETPQFISGPAGQIEAITTQPKESPESKIAIICHPHPLHGGTMNNKVVTTLVRTFNELKFHTVRFNFRGVGKSEGSFAEGIGELQDLLAIVTWVKQNYPKHMLWLAGFSFGGFIAAKAATQIHPAGLVTVAPQASRFTAEPFPEITVPWILIQGEQDGIVPAQEVYAWIDTLENKPLLIRIPDAGHFFHGKLLELRNRLFEMMKQFLVRRPGY